MECYIAVRLLLFLVTTQVLRLKAEVGFYDLTPNILQPIYLSHHD